MILYHAVQLATDLYLEKAYPEGPPEAIQALVNDLYKIDSNQSLLNWDHLEHEDDRYALRLGNEAYPHMRLVFLVKGNCNLFYVDAHDSHFAIHTHIPGQEKLKTLRDCNCALKKAIEKAWICQDLPVFGCSIPKETVAQTPMKRQVLAIDDEPQILDMLCLSCASIGLELDCATTVKQAMETIQKHAPDLVLCDIMMPDASGYVFVAWMQEHFPKIPVIFITGLNSDKVKTDGVEGVLQKPFTISDLDAMLKEIPFSEAS